MLMCLSLVGLAHTSAYAAGGPLGIDHRVNFDDHGIWKHNYQLGLIGVLVIGDVAGALYEGGESRLGRTMWQSIDSTIIAGASAQGLKHVFTRARPTQGNDPNQWFQGGSHYSFPSGEVSAITAIITPFVLEYGRDNPAVYALEVLPLYVGAARIKNQAHWQSDVLAGFALGTAAGWYSHSLAHPLTLSLMPHSIFVGLKRSW
jgi:undecaprenyl-diphosphatase